MSGQRLLQQDLADGPRVPCPDQRVMLRVAGSGLTEQQLDERCEAYLERRFRVHIDFAISQSLVYLLDDGIVRKDAQARDAGLNRNPNPNPDPNPKRAQTTGQGRSSNARPLARVSIHLRDPCP